MRQPRKPVRFIGITIVVTLLLLAAIVFWRQQNKEITVLDYGTTTVSSRFGHGENIGARTRRVRRGDIASQQVELSEGTWIDCAGDCAETLRKQKIDFWEVRRRREH